jgi:hypothetical protein
VIEWIIFPYGWWISRDGSGTQRAMHGNIGAWGTFRKFGCRFVVHPNIMIWTNGYN